MVKYEDSFKEKALDLLSELKRVGYVDYNGEMSFNVRDLCKTLGVSSKSLYSWKKAEIKPLEYEIQEPESEPEPEVITYIDEYDKKELYDSFIPEEEEISLDVNRSRFYSWLGGCLGIPNAVRLSKNQLKLKIGEKLIRESELIE